MKKSIAIGALALIMLTGCSSTSTPTFVPDKSNVSETITPAPVDQAALRESVFKTVIEKRLGPNTAEPAANLAKAFCKLLDDGGYTFKETANMAMIMADQKGLGASTMGAIVGAGVPTFCPQYIPELNLWMAGR